MTANTAWDEDRRIPSGIGPEAARSFVDRVIGPDALTASGGIRARVTPFYGMEVVATRARPVHDFLTGFQANRGGISFARPFAMADFAEAITHHTMADDEAGATKNCLRVRVSPPRTRSCVAAVVACIEFGNFPGRFNPEYVAAAADLVAAAHARIAEGLLLDALRASPGTSRSSRSPAARSRISSTRSARRPRATGHVTGWTRSATLDVLLPAWVVNMLQGDLARQPMGELAQFGQAEAGIRSWLAARGVRVGFYIDTPSTGVSQVFGAQPGGGLLDYPDAVQWGMWHPGAHLFLDGGTLDLGIVRDSTLNSTNDYQQFMETFEGHAFLGVESLWVEQAICPSGTQALPKDLSALCGGPYVPGS